MSSFSRESFISRLRGLAATQQGIQTLSLWCLHHRKHSNMVVSIWREEFHQCEVPRKIVLLYLANDIIQNSRKKGPEFRLSFQTVLKDAIRIASQADSKTYNATQRLLEIWEERGVFDEDYMRMLRSVHVEPRNYQPNTVDEFISGSLKLSTDADKNPVQSDSKITNFAEKSVKQSPIKVETQHTREMFIPMALRDLESESEDTALAQAIENPPATTELIEAIQLVTENPASTDKETRERIADIPPDVSDYKDSSIQKLKSKREASSLIKRASSAAETVTAYVKRLDTEQLERRKLAVRVRAFLLQQRNLLLRDHQILEESKARLAKVTNVRSELLKHLSNLPDLSQLPDLSRLAPLPAPRDLFR